MTVGKYIGIDLGGTKIAGVLADAGGTVLHRERSRPGRRRPEKWSPGLRVDPVLLAAAGEGRLKGSGFVHRALRS